MHPTPDWQGANKERQSPSYRGVLHVYGWVFLGFLPLEITDRILHRYMSISNPKKNPIIVHCIYRFTRCFWLASCLLPTWNTLTVFNINEFSTLPGVPSSWAVPRPGVYPLNQSSLPPWSSLCHMSQNTAVINTPSASTGPMAPKIRHSDITHMDCNAISLRPTAALPPHVTDLVGAGTDSKTTQGPM